MPAVIETAFADPKPGYDILELVTAQLHGARGVFLGEEHDQYLARDFLITHLAELKQAGVTTIYFEASDTWVSAARTHGIECLMAKDLDKLRTTNIDVAQQIEAVRKTGAEALFAGVQQNMSVHNRTYMQQLLKAAQAEGIAVIGHDTVGNGYARLSTRGILDHIDQRDQNSAHIVNSSAPAAPLNKFIILAGSDHSRRAASYVLPDQSTIRLGDGLPERLGIPSIDFTAIDNLNMHESLLAKGDAISKMLETRPYITTPVTDTSADFAVIHRNGFALLGEDAHQLPTGYNVAFTLFDEPVCRYQVTDDAVVLPPAGVENIIRTITAERTMQKMR